ncbi:MAG: hypothetical protein Q7J24_01930 [Desulfomicrobium sp.]|nr:hypothetical protein [Desulfomicrobium sp.]
MKMPIDVVAPFEVEDDHQSYIMHFTGGIQAWQRDKDSWSYGPIIYKGEPVMAGMLSTEVLRFAINQMGLSPIILAHRVCIDGSSSTILRSMNPNKKNDTLSAADVWGTISGNIVKKRVAAFRAQNPNATTEEVLKVINRKTSEEIFARFISESLRSMDICIDAISSYYHEQLVIFLREGKKVGERSSNIADLTCIANVHSFFLHLGAARDYLGALIAQRCGMPDNVDDMARLLDKLRWNNLPMDSILQTLIKRNVVTKKDNSEKCKLSGWLDRISGVRKQMVHKRPYGSHESEEYGHIRSAGDLKGHYRFWKPIYLETNSDQDALDFISDAYHKITELFGEVALASGNDTSIPILTDKEIKKLEVTAGKPPKEQI